MLVLSLVGVSVQNVMNYLPLVQAVVLCVRKIIQRCFRKRTEIILLSHNTGASTESFSDRLGLSM